MPSNGGSQGPPLPAPPSTSVVASMTMGFTEAAQANSIGLVMYNAAQAQQGCQQIELAALGLVISNLAVAAAKALGG